MRLRGASADDVPSMVAIERLSNASPWGERAFLDELKREISFAVVAEEDGAVVGYVVAWVTGDESEILNVAVDPQRRRSGIGAALVRAAIEGAASRGASVMHLEVRRSNSAARALYSELGFEESGVRSGYYQDGEDAILFTFDFVRALA